MGYASKCLVLAVITLVILLSLAVESQDYVLTQSITQSITNVQSTLSEQVGQTLTCLDCSGITTSTTTATTTPATTTATATPTTTSTYTLSLTTYTLTTPSEEEEDQAQQLLRGCVAVSPRYNSTLGLYQYFTYGDVAIYFEKGVHEEYGTMLPNNFGTYQVGCSDYYYCGFRSYVSFGYGILSGNVYGLLIIIGGSGSEGDIVTKYFVAHKAVIKIESDVRDTPAGSAVFWFLHIYTWNENNTLITDYRLPLWSWLYVSEQSSMYPYPIEVRSVYNTMAVYDCGRFHTPILVSSNPFLTALVNFFKWVYNMIINMLPDPVKNLFGLVGSLGNVITSIVTYLTNSQLLTIMFAIIPLLLLTYAVAMIERHGAFGVFQVFQDLFRIVKSIGEFIIKLIRSIIP